MKLSRPIRTREENHRLLNLRDTARKWKLKFQDLSLFDQALTHSSFGNEQEQSPGDNQRLEYLGDSVLGLVINEYLYLNYTSHSEGQLARMKSLIVSEVALARAALRLEIGSILLMGKGERNSGGAKRPSNLADALEAVIAAVYLDQGLPAAREFVLRALRNELDSLNAPGSIRDPKSLLQEAVQQKYHQHPAYEVVSEEGPQHSRMFVCRVLINGKEAGRGEGNSRKRAEQDAARGALEKMKEKSGNR